MQKEIDNLHNSLSTMRSGSMPPLDEVIAHYEGQLQEDTPPTEEEREEEEREAEEEQEQEMEEEEQEEASPLDLSGSAPQT